MSRNFPDSKEQKENKIVEIMPWEKSLPIGKKELYIFIILGSIRPSNVSKHPHWFPIFFYAILEVDGCAVLNGVCAQNFLTH